MSGLRRYAYVGPAALRERARAEPGAVIRSRAALAEWLRAHPDALREGATYVVGVGGELRLAPRRSEHIDCAGGEDVLAAGEIEFGGALVVSRVTNQSTGYCPDPDCWPAVTAALAAADIAGPRGFNDACVFRRCPGCGQTNIIKEGWFVCGVCDGELPRVWNFA